MTTRRQFLTAAVGVAFASRSLAEVSKVPIVDTHLHCFAGTKDNRFPYHKNGPYAPEESATPEHLLECMKAAEVDFAIVVHPEPYQDDHRYLEHCLNVGKRKLKGTCLFFAGREDNGKRMRELAKAVPLVATRIHAYNADRLPPFGKPELRDIWKLADELGLAVQLHFEPRYAPGFEPLIKEFTKVRVLIDHLGRPLQGTPKEYDIVTSWAKFDNVTMKLSAVPERGKYPHSDPTPILKRLVDAFGAERLMYGGGFDGKATGKTYKAERERIASLLPRLSEGDVSKIFGGTAAKLFQFKLA